MHDITGEESNVGDIDNDDNDVGMTWDDCCCCCCDASDDAYEYSKGFVIAMSELRISGVLGVLEQNSIPTPSRGGVDSDVWLKLYIFHVLRVFFIIIFICKLVLLCGGGSISIPNREMYARKEENTLESLCKCVFCIFFWMCGMYKWMDLKQQKKEREFI